MKYFTTLLLLGYLFSGQQASAQNTWLQKANFAGTARLDPTSFAIGNKGYIGLGYNNGSGTAFIDFWEYDPSSDSWTQKANFSGTARGWAEGFAIGTSGFVGMGYDLTNYLSDFWEWNQSLNTWIQRTNFPGTPSCETVGFSIGTKGYMLDRYNQLFEYDPIFDSWTGKAYCPETAYIGQSAFAVGNKAYLMTGKISIGNYSSEVWEWDQTTDVWTQKNPFTHGVNRSASVAFSIGNYGFLGTGMDENNNYHRDFWEYDPAGDMWYPIASLPGVPRYVATGFSIGNKGYIGAGFYGGDLKDFWEYTPGTASVIETASIQTTLYPNPFTTEVTFVFSNELRKAELKLFDVSGKEMRSNIFSGKQITIQREDLPSGIYFYQLILDNRIVSSGKLIAK